MSLERPEDYRWSTFKRFVDSFPISQRVVYDRELNRLSTSFSYLPKRHRGDVHEYDDIGIIYKGKRESLGGKGWHQNIEGRVCDESSGFPRFLYLFDVHTYRNDPLGYLNAYHFHFAEHPLMEKAMEFVLAEDFVPNRI